jgi:DNA repair exonuclease SbcCD ATPase subunit
MLYIKKIRLKNFLNIKECDLDTDNQIIVISGPSGSGKSAVFEAIRTIISSKKRSDRFLEYVRQGCERAEIYLEAEIHGKDYIFEVEINARRGAAFGLTIKQEDHEYKNTEAQDLIKSLDLDYYSDIILTMQGDQDITELSPAARSEYLKRLLNFDFSQQLKRAREEVSQFESRIIELQKDEAVKTALIDAKSRSKKEPIDVTKYDDSKLREIEKELTIEVAGFNSQRNCLIEFQNKKSSLQTTQGAIIKKISTLDNQITEIKSKLLRNDEILAEVEECNKKVDELSLKKSVYESNVLKAKKLVEDHQKDYDSQVKYYGIIHESFIEASRLKKLLNEGKCPHCGQETTTHTEVVLKDFIAEISKTEQGIIEYLESIEKIVIYLTLRLREMEEAVNNSQELLKSSQELLKEKETDLSLLIRRTIDFENQSKTLLSNMNTDSEVDGLEKNNLVREKRRLIGEQQDLDEKILQIDNEIGQIDLSLFETVCQRLSAVTQNIRQMEGLRQEAETIIKDNISLSNDIVSLKTELDLIKEEYGKIQRDIDCRNDAIKILEKDLPNYMIVKTCASLESEMNEFIHSIFPKYCVRLQQKKGGTEFFYTQDISLKETSINSWINSKMSSGFEKAMLTLAFKVSLCKMYDLRFCVLDECDKAADDESSEKLFEQVIGDEIFEQIWIISHKKSTCQLVMDNAMDGKLFYVRGGTFTEEDSIYD